MIYRQTKYVDTEGKFLTKYLLVNNLVGPEAVVQQVHSSLTAFLEAFHGSFTVKWSMGVLA